MHYCNKIESKSNEIKILAKFYEREDDVPSVHDLVYMGDRAFTHQAVLNAEVKLVHSLEFELQATTPLSFLHLYW